MTDFVWDGSADNSWINPANWDVGSGWPSAPSDKATIGTGSATIQFDITAQDPAKVGEIVVTSGFSGEIHQEQALAIDATGGENGFFTIGGGTWVTANENFSITGEFKMTGGTFTSADSDVQVRNVYQTAGTLTLPSASGSFYISGANVSDGGGGQGYAFRIDGGTTTHSSGTVEFASAVDTAINVGGSRLNTIIFDSTGSNVNIEYIGDMRIVGNLTLEDDIRFWSYNNSGTYYDLEVDGDVIVHSGCILGETAMNQQFDFGSLEVKSGGTFVATSDVTTLTAETTGGDCLELDSGSTFTNNKGTILFHGPNTRYRVSSTGIPYNVEVQDGGQIYFYTALAVENNLTITNGSFVTDSGVGATVPGTLLIASGEIFGHSTGTWSADSTIGTLINHGTLKGTKGTMTVGTLRQLGTYVHSGGDFVIAGTGGLIEGSLGQAKVKINQGSVFTFDGANDYITLYSGGSTSDFDVEDAATWSAWIYPTSATNFKRIIGKMYTTSWSLMMVETSNLLRLEIHNGSGAVDHNSASAILLNTWTHVAVTFDAGNNEVKFYINGVLDATRAETGNISVDTVDVRIGRDNHASHFWNGKLADVRMFNTDLDASDTTAIETLASKINVDPALVGSESNCISYHKLTEGLTVTDENVNGGTAYNGVLAGLAAGDLDYDQFSVDIQDNTTTMGHVDVAQGVLNPKALTTVTMSGSNQRVQSASFDFRLTAASYTVAMWIKPTDVSGLERICFSDQVMQLSCSDDDVVWVPNYGTGFTAAPVLTAGKWHHIIGTFNASDNAAALYVDGILGASGTDSTTDTTDKGAKVIFFGYKQDSDPVDDYTGSMRDIRMYDYALSAGQAASLYSGSYPVTPEYGWKLDEGTGNASGFGTAQTGGAVDLSHNAGWADGTMNLEGMRVLGNGTVN